MTQRERGWAFDQVSRLNLLLSPFECLRDTNYLNRYILFLFPPRAPGIFGNSSYGGHY